MYQLGYLLLITDNTKNSALIELILKMLQLNFTFIQGSKLKEDQTEIYVLKKAWSIISSMEKGETIVLKDLETLYPKFYDLFNKNLITIGNEQFARIILDSNTNEITRKQIEENEKKAEKCMNLCEESRQKLRKQNKLFVDISTGIDTLLLILSHKNFEEAIKNKIINDKDANDESDFEKKYTELIQSSKKNNDKDIIERLKQLNEVLKVIEGGCSDIRNHYRFDDEIQKLDRKEENEIENIYINAQEEQDEDDEYEQEDDMVPEMSTKDGRKNEYDSGMRPYSSVPSKPKRISISAKDKNY